MYCRVAKLLITVLLVAAGYSWGQAVSGTLSGRVTGPAGAAIPNTAVTITNIGTNVSQRVLTGPDGTFSVSGLAPGTYRVDVESAGYKRTSQQNIELATSGPSTVNITLEAGSANETVEIKGHSPTVDGESAEQSEGLTTRVVRELPIIDRNHQQLIELTPGTTPPNSMWPMAADPERNRYWSANGQDPTINLPQLDGVTNLEPFRGSAIRVAPMESVHQMSVTNANQTADKGFNGGTAYNLVTRGGTNDWHGSLFEFHSNNNLRARNFFNTAGNPDPKLVYNQFGGTVGGAIVPDRFFFFGSYEGMYDRGSNTQITTVPTSQMLQGNFSAVPGVTIYNPQTGTAAGMGRSAFANNTIPSAAINPTSAAIAAYFPSANLPGFTNNYVANTPYQNDGNKFDGRIDAHFSDRTSAFLRYGYTNYRTVEGSILGPVIGDGGRNRLLAHNAVANVTHAFTPAFLGELRLGYNRYFAKMRDINDQSGLAGQLGFNGANFLPNIQLAGFGALGTPVNIPANAVDNTYNIASNWNAHTSMHNIKFGVDLRDYRSDGFNNLMFGPLGGYVFGPGTTSAAGAPLSQYSVMANSFAAFLAGAPTYFGTTSYLETPAIRQRQYAAYLADTLNLRRLSLELGVRYEVYSPLEPRHAGGAQTFNPATNTFNFPGLDNTSLHSSLYDLNNVAPRVGLALRVTERTVVRGGYAINYFQTPYMNSGYMAAATGFFEGVAGGYASAPGGFGAANFPAFQTGTAPPAPANGMMAYNGPLSVVPHHIDTPYVQNFSLGVQQEIVDTMMIGVAYIGALGRHLPFSQEINSALPGTGIMGIPLGFLGRTGSTLLYDNGLTNNYNSLQVKLTKRMAHGLAFNAVYTWSKALGYTGTNGMLLNPFDLRSNYGPLDWDRQHVLTISHLWNLPFGAGTNHLNRGVVGQLLGNWQINGIFTWATGTPFTVTADPLLCNCPGNIVVANVNGPVSFSNGIGNGATFFNVNAFQAPGAGQFGNLGRNSLRGPGYRNYDLSLFRSFPIKERFKLEFRGEAYNLTNSPRFLNPVTNFNAADFGQVTRTINGTAGRQVNLGVRLLF